MASLDTTLFFQSEDFSDITIMFSGRQMKCHKIILCTRSEYFRTLCGPGSKFVESRSNEVELYGDDPDAVERVLKYIYTGDTTPDRPEDWLYQLEVSKAATKYMLEPLEVAAFRQFRMTLDLLKESDVVLYAMNTIRDKGDQAKHLEAADSLEKNHRSALLHNEDYRKLVEEDTTLLWKLMDGFNYAEDVKQLEMRKCTRCHRVWANHPGSAFAPATCSGSAYNQWACMPGNDTGKCWMSIKEALRMYGRLK